MNGRSLFRRLTSGSRALPDFVIVGAQKAGTTAMFKCLREHPDVDVLTKEVHYFDNNYHKGEKWYRSHFPLKGRLRAKRHITGEASPYYLFHPLAMRRLLNDLPNVKIIAMLRDPIERALSHYFHEVRYGYEHLPVKAAFDAEKDRLEGERERIVSERGYYSFRYQHYSYVARGRYFEQLEPYLTEIGNEKILLIRSENFFDDPATVYSKVLDYLGLCYFPVSREPIANVGKREVVTKELRAQLEGGLAEDIQKFNERLTGFVI